MSGLPATTADTLSHDNFPGAISALSVSKIISYDGTNKILAAECIVTSSNWGTGSMKASFIFDTIQSKWLFYGNQKAVYLLLRPGVQKTISASGTSVTGILSIYAEATAGSISQIAVAGPGLAGNPTILSKGSNGTMDHFYTTNNGSLTSPAAVGSVYTIYVTKSDGTILTYAEMIKATTAETFAVTASAGHAIPDAQIGSPLTVSWTLPTSFEIDSITLVGWVNDSNGGFLQPPQIYLDKSATSASITLPQPPNGAIATNAGIGIFATGTKGEQSIVNYIFE